MDAAHTLFDQPRDGRTFAPREDQARLADQHARVWAVVSDEKWRTLAEIAAATGAPEASVSARLRDFRKPRFGGHEVLRRRRERGVHEYRVIRSVK